PAKRTASERAARSDLSDRPSGLFGDVLFLIHRAPRREGVIERGWGPARIKKCWPSRARPTPSEREARSDPDDRMRASAVTFSCGYTARRLYGTSEGPAGISKKRLIAMQMKNF